MILQVKKAVQLAWSLKQFVYPVEISMLFGSKSKLLTGVHGYYQYKPCFQQYKYLIIQ